MGLTREQAISQYGSEAYTGWDAAGAAADAKAKGIQPGSQSSSSNRNSLTDYYNQQNQLQQSAIQPAIQSLQASIPNIQKNYETQISQKQSSIAPLQDRYKSLIDQIKNQGQTMANKQTVVTAGNCYFGIPDTKDLLDKMEKVYKTDRIKMSNNAREYILSKYDFDKVLLPKWVKFFEDVEKEVYPLIDEK